MAPAARLFEDFQVGETWESAPTRITAEAIVAFGRDYDPQPMHVDADYAAKGPFGVLIASGWQVAAIAMREFVRAGGHGSTPMLGLGADELRWHAPLRAGDEVIVRRELVEARRSASDPRFGVLRAKMTVRRTDGTLLLSFLSAGRVPTRDATGGTP